MLHTPQLQRTPTKSSRAWHVIWRYGMAAGLAGIALLWSLLLQPYVSDTFVIIFLATVMTAGWFGGTGP
ncbi:MAG TPA: hypothetical protein VFO86_04785, partial [Terriglobia bacterium]|nr:hypothetical protein [Terriglobia bacterium]